MDKVQQINKMLNNKYGRTRAEWQVIERGVDWDGTLLRKKDIAKRIQWGKCYTILPYYGGLYPSKIEMWGDSITILLWEK